MRERAPEYRKRIESSHYARHDEEGEGAALLAVLGWRMFLLANRFPLRRNMRRLRRAHSYRRGDRENGQCGVAGQEQQPLRCVERNDGQHERRERKRGVEIAMVILDLQERNGRAGVRLHEPPENAAEFVGPEAGGGWGNRPFRQDRHPRRNARPYRRIPRRHQHPQDQTFASADQVNVAVGSERLLQRLRHGAVSDGLCDETAIVLGRDAGRTEIDGKQRDDAEQGQRRRPKRCCAPRFGPVGELSALCHGVVEMVAGRSTPLLDGR
jgi:hypothetical protein